jgi:transposase
MTSSPSKKTLQRFVKRLNRHKDELFTFLYEKDIDYHNNHAEQQIRPDVIFRKITFQNRSLKGAKNHQALMSILQTAKLNNIDPIKALTQILNGKNPLSGVMASCKRSPPQINYAG